MRTPEEIKKGLYVCAKLDGDCESCPYDDRTIFCEDKIRKDALAYIQQLESTYSQVSKALCDKENATLDEMLDAVDQLTARIAGLELGVQLAQQRTEETVAILKETHSKLAQAERERDSKEETE